MINNIRIKGLRGFASEQTLDLAIPNGQPGSGLTIVVGANNAGKSTLIEAFRAMVQSSAPSFSEGRRNLHSNKVIEIKISGKDGEYALTTIQGSSESKFAGNPANLRNGALVVLPSRRFFPSHFGKGTIDRSSYMTNIGFPMQRSSTLEQFTSRLFDINGDDEKRKTFDTELRKIIEPPLNWSIELSESGSHYLKILKNDIDHSSEGMGEGFVSALYIVDAIAFSQPNFCVVIDEPELSLHPSLQRKIAKYFLENSTDRQIVIATHSPYFTDLSGIANGGTLARITSGNEGTTIHQLKPETALNLKGLLNNKNNPHILGLNAQEIFFSEDQIILFEGQEDVVFFPAIKEELLPNMVGNVFGWGVGGADNMGLISTLLSELGFKAVAGILDGNRRTLAGELQKAHPNYRFKALPADDIRNKPATAAKQPVVGLLDDENTRIRAEHKISTSLILTEIDQYLRSPTPILETNQ